MSDLPTIAIEGFDASAVVGSDAIQVTLSGNADQSVLPELESFVPTLHAEARRHRVKEVVVDLTHLEFMNSSCFRTFVNWVGWIRRLEEAEQYGLRFIATPTQHWQKPSLQALSCFATNIVKVDNLSL